MCFRSHFLPCNINFSGPVYLIQFTFRRLEIPPDYNANHLGKCDSKVRWACLNTSYIEFCSLTQTIIQCINIIFHINCLKIFEVECFHQPFQSQQLTNTEFSGHQFFLNRSISNFWIEAIACSFSCGFHLLIKLAYCFHFCADTLAQNSNIYMLVHTNILNVTPLHHTFFLGRVLCFSRSIMEIHACM